MVGIPEGEIRICVHSTSASVSLLVSSTLSVVVCACISNGALLLGPRLFEWSIFNLNPHTHSLNIYYWPLYIPFNYTTVLLASALECHKGSQTLNRNTSWPLSPCPMQHSRLGKGKWRLEDVVKIKAHYTF